MGILPTGKRGLGISKVRGYNLVPLPAAKIKPFIWITIYHKFLKLAIEGSLNKISQKWKNKRPLRDSQKIPRKP